MFKSSQWFPFRNLEIKHSKKKKNVLNDSNAVFIYLGAKKRKKVMETPFFFSSCKTQQQKQRRGLIKPIEMLNLEERVMYGL